MTDVEPWGRRAGNACSGNSPSTGLADEYGQLFNRFGVGSFTTLSERRLERLIQPCTPHRAVGAAGPEMEPTTSSA